MNTRLLLRLLCLLVLLTGLSACSNDDDYRYPSVLLEFATVSTGADGAVATIHTDAGNALPVAADRTGSRFQPNVSLRVVCHYEVHGEDRTPEAELYSLYAVPVTPPVQSIEGGLKTDPVSVISIWKGRDYLNMVLNVRIKGDEKRTFAFLEERVEAGTGETVVTLLLHHDAKVGGGYLNRRSYLSVPLAKYREANPGVPLRVKFKYHTTDGEGGTVLSEQYCNPGFVYAP